MDLGESVGPTSFLAFKVLGDNLLSIEFENEWEKARVLKGMSWVFEGSLFSIEDFDRLSSPSEIDFECAAFSVRMFCPLLAWVWR